MVQDIEPKETKRLWAFEMWMTSPMPMVTITKTFEVSHLVKTAKKRGMSFTALMCFCIAKAASQVEEFYMVPKGDKFLKYDSIGVDVIVKNAQGGINMCDVPYNGDLGEFMEAYHALSARASSSSTNLFDEERMIIGTSALPNCEFDSVTNQYSAKWANPFLVWGRYRKGLFKTTLPVSLQFHHVQMNGEEACEFLHLLQEAINKV